jgi:hypothetical protein
MAKILIDENLNIQQTFVGALTGNFDDAAQPPEDSLAIEDSVQEEVDTYQFEEISLKSFNCTPE